jgi:hypothetical protein
MKVGPDISVGANQRPQLRVIRVAATLTDVARVEDVWIGAARTHVLPVGLRLSPRGVAIIQSRKGAD